MFIYCFANIQISNIIFATFTNYCYPAIFLHKTVFISPSCIRVKKITKPRIKFGKDTVIRQANRGEEADKLSCVCVCLCVGKWKWKACIKAVCM